MNVGFWDVTLGFRQFDNLGPIAHLQSTVGFLTMVCKSLNKHVLLEVKVERRTPGFVSWGLKLTATVCGSFIQGVR